MKLKVYLVTTENDGALELSAFATENERDVFVRDLLGKWHVEMGLTTPSADHSIAEMLEALVESDCSNTLSTDETILEISLDNLAVQNREEGDQAFIDGAYSYLNDDDDVEVDGEPFISKSDDGAFVSAWLWVSNHDAGLPDDDEELKPTIEDWMNDVAAGGITCGYDLWLELKEEAKLGDSE